MSTIMRTTTLSGLASDDHQLFHCGSLRIKETTVLPRQAVARGGPVPALVRSGRWPLPVWLLLVAAATPERALVDLRYYRIFASGCLGLSLSDRRGGSVRSTVARALARLVELRLVTVEEKRHGRLIVQLLALDGSGAPYAMPQRAVTKVVHVPTGLLFANGWHRALTTVELASLMIALTEESWQFHKFGQHEWEKSRVQIARDYGIAASTWSRGKDGLFGRGLLKWDLPTLAPGSGPERVPTDRYTVDLSSLALRPEDAPRFMAWPIPTTITAPGTGMPLRLHRVGRIQISPAQPAAAAGLQKEMATPRRSAY